MTKIINKIIHRRIIRPRTGRPAPASPAVPVRGCGSACRMDTKKEGHGCPPFFAAGCGRHFSDFLTYGFFLSPLRAFLRDCAGWLILCNAVRRRMWLACGARILHPNTGSGPFWIPEPASASRPWLFTNYS